MTYRTVREIFTKVNKSVMKTPSNCKGLDGCEYIYSDILTNANICAIALNN